MIERRIEINEAVLKCLAEDVDSYTTCYWLAMMPVASDSYINGYATGIIAAFQVLGLFDLLKVNEEAETNPVNILNQVRNSEVI